MNIGTHQGDSNHFCIDLPEETELDCALKIKWKRKRYDFTKEDLKELLDPIGKVESLELSEKKKGSAIIVFKTVVDAVSYYYFCRSHNTKHLYLCLNSMA